MPQWKRVLALCLLPMLLALAGCGSKKTDLETVLEKGTLRVLMSPEFPPYEYRDAEGTIVGADVEIAKRVASMLGVQLEIVECNYAQLEDALLSGEGDMILSAFPASENRQGIMCSVVYLSTAQYVLVKAENEAITIEEDLEGKILGVQQDSHGDIYATDQVSAKNIQRFPKLNEAVQLLLSGKLDGVIADQATADAFVEEYGDTLRKVYIGDNAANYCIGLPEDSAMQQQVDALLTTMQSSGEIKRYVLQHTMEDESALSEPSSDISEE